MPDFYLPALILLQISLTHTLICTYLQEAGHVDVYVCTGSHIRIICVTWDRGHQVLIMCLEFLLTGNDKLFFDCMR